MLYRVIGTETEYGDYTTKNGKPYSLSQRKNQMLYKIIESCLPQYLKPDLFAFLTGNAFLMNGAKLYVDTGFHMEYAAYEGRGPREALINELAGGRIVEEMAELARLKWQDEKIVVRFIKNNLDGHSINVAEALSWHSFGSHDNYQVSLESIFNWNGPWTGPSGWIPVIGEILAPHFISRMLYAGNGWVATDNRKLSYLISQRGLVTTDYISGSTTTLRPIICSRDERHADGSKWGRLHVILGDSLLLETALFLKLGTTDILLDAIEEGFLRSCPCGAWNKKTLLKALHTFTKDPTLRAVCEDAQGRQHTIISIQKTFRDIARKFVEESGHIDETRKLVLKLWDKILDAAESPKPYLVLARDVDWACQQLFLEKEMDDKKFGWKTAPEKNVAKNNLGGDLTALDYLKWCELKFHKESQDGMARFFTDHGFANRISTEEEIQSAQRAPLPTTRAFARHNDLVRLYEFAKEKGIRLFVRADWTYIVASIYTSENTAGNVVYTSSQHLMLDPLEPYPYLPDLPDTVDG